MWKVLLMSLAVKAGAFAIGTGAPASTVAVTGVGFIPKALIFFWNGQISVVNSNGIGNIRRGMGFVATPGTPGNQCLVTSFSLNAQATSACEKGYRDDGCVQRITTGGVDNGRAHLTSYDADGFTLTIDTTFGVSNVINYIAIGGNDVVNVTRGRFTVPVTATTKAITGAGFQPDLIFLAGAGIAAAPPSYAVDSSICFGVYAREQNQNAIWAGGGDNGAVTSQAISYARLGESLAMFDAGVTVLSERGSVISSDPDGFTISMSEVLGTANQYEYLAIKGGSYKLSGISLATDTVTTKTESVGFSPKGVFLAGANALQDAADTPHNNDERNFGAFSAVASQGQQSSQDFDAQVTTITGTIIGFDRVVAHQTTVGTLDLVTAITDIGNDSFSYLNSVTNAVAVFLWYLAMGDNYYPPVPKRPESSLVRM